uniref:DUF7866 domain-containing protein n=1 Tax=Ananas comosus var. bracteatus TaxID=296719 RepID=A0A6V7PDW9_ANACO|nr:unnamed protein product [Ananas comosus var. bracteatus]
MTLLSLSLFITGTCTSILVSMITITELYDPHARACRYVRDRRLRFPEKGSATVAAEVSEVGNATTLDVFKRCLACRCCIGDGRFCFNTKCCYQIYCKIPDSPPTSAFSSPRNAAAILATDRNGRYFYIFNI